jgi:hypothetical protein
VRAVASPIRDQLHRRLQPFRRLHDCSGCFRLERPPGGTCTHWKAPPSHGARSDPPRVLSEERTAVTPHAFWMGTSLARPVLNFLGSFSSSDMPLLYPNGIRSAPNPARQPAPQPPTWATNDRCRYASDAQITLDVAVEADSYATLKDLVRNGHGWTILLLPRSTKAWSPMR